jgi:hypothetical protein
MVVERYEPWPATAIARRTSEGQQVQAVGDAAGERDQRRQDSA